MPQPWEMLYEPEAPVAPPIPQPQQQGSIPPWQQTYEPDPSQSTSPQSPVEGSASPNAKPWEMNYQQGPSQSVETPVVDPHRQANAEKPWAVTRGLASSLLEQTPEAVAGTLEGFSHLVPESYKQTFADGAAKVRSMSKGLRPEEYKMVAPSILDVKSLDEGMSSVGEIFGQGLGSSIPSIAGAGIGGGIGSAVPGVGTTAGAIGGGILGGAALNYNDIYDELKKAGVEPSRAAKISLAVLPVLSGLDMAGMVPALRLTGITKAIKQEASRGFARYIAKEFGKGTVSEGLTEGAQKAVNLSAVSAETGKDLLTAENAKKVLEETIGGMIAGGPLTAATAAVTREGYGGVNTPASEEDKKAFMHAWEQNKPADWVSPIPPPSEQENIPTSSEDAPKQIERMGLKLGSGGPSLSDPADPVAARTPVPDSATEPALPQPGPESEAESVEQLIARQATPPLGPDVFFSALYKQLNEKGPKSATPEEWSRQINNWKNMGVKQEEIDWLGIPNYLENQAGTGKVSKQDMLNHVAERFTMVYPGEDVATMPTTDMQVTADPYLGHIVTTPVGTFRVNTEDPFSEPGPRGTNLNTWFVHDAHAALDMPNYRPFSSLQEAVSNIRTRVSNRIRSNAFRNGEATKYDQYVHPGPRGDYFEVKLTLPNLMRLTHQEPYVEGHFPESPNTFVSVMATERVDHSGNNGILLDAVQSDLHQQGREKGYQGTGPVVTQAELDAAEKNWQITHAHAIDKLKDLFPTYTSGGAKRQALNLYNDIIFFALRNSLDTEVQRQREDGINLTPEHLAVIKTAMDAEAHFDKISQDKYDSHKIPNTPFKDTRTWSEIAVKRMIRWAADAGYRRLYFPQGSMVGKYNTGGAAQDAQLKGINYYYDTVLPSIAKKVAKRLGADFGEVIGQPSSMPGLKIIQSPNTGRYAIRDDYNRNYGTFDRIEDAQRELAGLQVEVPPVMWHYIELNDNARTNAQLSQALFSKVQGPPRGTATIRVSPAIKKGASVNPLYNAAVRMAHAVDAWVKSAGIKEKVVIKVIDKIPTRSASGKGATAGLAEKFPDGTFAITVNLRAHQTSEQVWASMIHEFGHIIFWTKWQKLSVLQQQAIKSEYNRTLGMVGKDKTVNDILPMRDNAIVVATGLRGNWPQRLNELKPKEAEYWQGFFEWFPEQVVKWTTTNEKALTLVDRVMKGIGDTIRKFVHDMSKKFGLSYAPGPAMTQWLNSFLESTPNIFPDSFAQVDVTTKDQNEKAVAKEVPNTPMPPQQPVTVGPRIAIQGAFTPQAGNTPAPPKSAAPPPTGPTPPSGGLPPTATPTGATPAGAIPPPVAAQAAHADRINWFYKWMTGLGQLVSANPLFAPLVAYHGRVKIMHNEEVRVQDAALRVSKKWRKLGGPMGDKLTEFLDYMANMRYRTPQEVQNNTQRHPTPQETAAEANRLGLSQEARDLALLIKANFDGMLTLSVNNALADAQKRITDPQKLILELNRIRASETAMKAKPYFPFMRFGRYYVLVKDANGDTLHFETVERKGVSSAEHQQSQLEASLRAAYPGADITKGVLPESVEPFMGMPPLLLEAMLDKLNLTAAQREAVKQLQFELSPSLSFKHHFQNKNYVPGYSMDYKRAFARYMFSGARYITRTRHIDGLKESIKAARAIPDNKANRIADYMQDHLDNTILDARGDFGILKGAIFLWAMGYVPAAATQNLSQTPMITWPFLGAKFGDFAATRELIKAMTDMTNFYKRGFYDNQTDFELKAISYGIKTGRISEAQAAELAGIGQGTNLLLGYGGNRAQRGWSHFQEKAAWMFEIAEQFNRRVAFRAALRLAMQKPNAKITQEAINRYQMEYNELVASGQYSPAQARAVITASHAVDQTQYVYAKYDRPRFMRGRMSGALFVFKKYMQSTLVMLGQNPDVMMRYLVVAAALGGLAGVPGYDDFKSLLRAMAHWLFGKDFNLDRSVKEYVNQFSDGTINSDLVLHGLARKGFGIPAILDLMGSFATGTPGRGFDPGGAKNVPFPVIDRSRALSMGNILPVDLGKLIGPTKDVNSTIAEQTQKASGAVFSVGFNIYKAIMDNHLAASDPKRWERAVPRMLASTSRSFRAFTEGRERGSRGGPSSGNTIIPYDVRDPEQMMEALALAGGYQPVRLAEKWDNILAKAEVTTYYKLQRDGLLEQFYEAAKSRNPGELQAVRDAVSKYNKGLPDYAKGMSLSPDTISKSVQTRSVQGAKREAGVPMSRGEAPIHQHINKLYPVVEERRVR